MQHQQKVEPKAFTNQLRDDTVCRNKKLNPKLLWTSSATIQCVATKSWTQNFYKPAPWQYSVSQQKVEPKTCIN